MFSASVFPFITILKFILVKSDWRIKSKAGFLRDIKSLLQQLINSIFIQNFHRLQVHVQHSITSPFKQLSQGKTNNQEVFINLKPQLKLKQLI